MESSGSDCDSNLDSELSSHSLPTHYQAGKKLRCYCLLYVTAGQQGGRVVAPDLWGRRLKCRRG